MIFKYFTKLSLAKSKSILASASLFLVFFSLEGFITIPKPLAIPPPPPITFCEVVPDGSFENGNYSSGSPTSFAGGTYVDFDDETPDSWSKATVKGENYCVESTAAYNGNKYVYAFSDGKTATFNDACNEYYTAAASPNTCYQICVFAADARADGNSSGLAIEIEEKPSLTFHYLSIELADNPAWDDNALTTIPWQQHCYSFTTQSNTNSGTIWISASAEVGTGTTSYIVVDDMSVCSCGGTELEAGEICSSVSNQSIVGTVFEDWNYDGAMNQSDTIGVEGVEVELYDDCGSVTQTTTTDSNGNYQFSGLTPNTTYRVEFVLPTSISDWAEPTKAGVDNGTMVQFVEPGNCASLGIAAPSDYCQENPRVAVACYESGTGVGNANAGLVSFSYNESGLPIGYETSTDPPTTPGTAAKPRFDGSIEEVGSVNGTAWQATQKRLFLSSFLKRFVGFADSPGYVYVIDYSGGTASAAGNFDLQGVAPANGGSNIDFGTICRSAACANDAGNTGIDADYELPISPTSASVDLDAFAKVGAISYGDAEISDDGNTLWLVNLFQKSLISVDVSGTSATLPGTTNQYLLSSLSGVPSCTGGEFRPWALAFEKGKGYLGGVCDASVSQDSTNLVAYVLSFDPANVGSGFTTVLSFDLDYNRELGQSGGTPTNLYWNPWADDWNQLNPYTNGSDNNYMGPQPILADIDFADNGDMVIGLMDRFGHQNGRANYKALSGNMELVDTNSGGDLVHACKSGNVWVIEGTGSCTDNDNNVTGDPINQLLQTDGPSNTGEFYYEDYFTEDIGDPSYFTHAETFNGNLAIVKGNAEVVGIHYDPLWGPPRIVNSQGVVWYNTYTGARTDAYQIVESSAANPQTFAKANGLGDLEALCDPAPLEIGNYVWEDTDGDGIQDACEMGMENVILTIFNEACEIVAIDTTDSNGNYYFNDAKVAEYTAQADTTLAANSTYYIVVSGAVGGGWTTSSNTLSIGSTDYKASNTTQGVRNEIDSNGAVGTNASPCNGVTEDYIFTTVETGDAGEVDHSFDFGLKVFVCPTGKCGRVMVIRN